MIEREPSRTALAAAAYRAAHQVLEGGAIFQDPLAIPLLGLDPELLTQNPQIHQAQRGIRFFVNARSSIAEGLLMQGVDERGIGQLVVLGAGLDTFAYRNPFPERLRVIEVDHPATQAWKRRRLQEAGIAIPDGLTYAPLDFEGEDLTRALVEAGVVPHLRTFFSWLGVVPYLTREAVEGTLAQIARFPGGAEVVFDYGEPREQIDPALRQQADERAQRVAAIGEPFLSYFRPDEIRQRLKALGFGVVEDFGLPDMLKRFFGPLPDGAAPPKGGGHVIYTAV